MRETWLGTATMSLILAIKKDIHREADAHTCTPTETFDKAYARNTQQTHSRITSNQCPNRYPENKCLSFTRTHRLITGDRSRWTFLEDRLGHIFHEEIDRVDSNLPIHFEKRKNRKMVRYASLTTPDPARRVLSQSPMPAQ